MSQVDPKLAPTTASPTAATMGATMLAPSRPGSHNASRGPDAETVPGRATGSRAAVSVDGATAYAAERPALPPRADAADALVGRRIDHFEVRGRLGEGGMGAVYLAHDLSLDRPVAIKVLRAELARDAALIDRLIMEARAQARLQHPHVVTIYYIGSHDQAPYFAMEYVRGRSLEEHITDRGPMPWAEALEYVIQAARALQAAYKRGIVHRDIKPSNLILADDRGGAAEVMVADFGLAVPAGDREGSFAGSPHYASPEQIDGLPLDCRSDIYALGVTFHQLLTGVRPFDGTTLTDLFAKHRQAPRPPIPEERAPWKLRHLVAVMMDADRAARPDTYEALIARLEALRPREAATAGLMARAMALAVDLTLLAIAGQALAGLSPLSQVVANQAGMVLFGVYQVFSHHRWRRTLGKQLFGLRLVSEKGRLTWWRLVMRFAVGFWGPILAMLMISLQLGAATNLETVKDQMTRVVGVKEIPIIDDSLQALLRTVLVPNLLLAIPWLAGFAFAFFDPRRQTLHDRVAGTRVVYRHR